MSLAAQVNAVPTRPVRSARFTVALAPWDDPETARLQSDDLSTPGLRYRMLCRRFMAVTRRSH